MLVQRVGAYTSRLRGNSSLSCTRFLSRTREFVCRAQESAAGDVVSEYTSPYEWIARESNSAAPMRGKRVTTALRPSRTRDPKPQTSKAAGRATPGGFHARFRMKIPPTTSYPPGWIRRARQVGSDCPRHTPARMRHSASRWDGVGLASTLTPSL